MWDFFMYIGPCILIYRPVCLPVGHWQPIVNTLAQWRGEVDIFETIASRQKIKYVGASVDVLLLYIVNFFFLILLI